MKIKNLLLLTILAASYAPHSNAMYRPLVQKVTGRMSTFLAKIAKGAVNHPIRLKNSLSAYFYGALIMQNPDTNKTVILLPDVHVPHSWTVSPKKEINLAQTQQHQVITLAKTLEQLGDKVHVIVEDPAEFFQKNGESVIPGHGGQYYSYSPVWCLERLCKSKDIASCTNVEFREDEPLKQYEIRNQIRNKIDAGTLQKLYHYYSDGTKESAELDAAIINTIQADNNSSTILVCAGGAHIGSVSKILYQHGYTKTHVKASKNLPLRYENYLYNFAKNDTLPEATYELPSHLPNITTNVLDAMAILKQQQTLKKLTSQLYAASNLFS